LDLVRLKYGFALIRIQKYNETSAVLEYWRLMLLVALTCFITDKKQQLFFPEREEKRKERRKKGYASSKAM
jgi:hypothetical protein